MSDPVARLNAALSGRYAIEREARRRRDGAKGAWHLRSQSLEPMGPSGPAAAVDALLDARPDDETS